MNKELIILVEEAPEGGFLARGGGHTILSKAGNLRQLRDEFLSQLIRGSSAKKLNLPSPIRLRFRGEEMVVE